PAEPLARDQSDERKQRDTGNGPGKRRIEPAVLARGRRVRRGGTSLRSAAVTELGARRERRAAGAARRTGERRATIGAKSPAGRSGTARTGTRCGCRSGGHRCV